MHSEKPARCNIAFLVILCLFPAAVPCARAQTYTFSACSGGPVPNPQFTNTKGTFTVTITQVVSGGAVPGAPGSADYTVMANFTATTALGAAKNFTNAPATIAVGFLPIGPNGQTSFMISPPSPAGAAVPPDGRWSVNLLGDGNLLSGNGLPAALPPISVWTTAARGNLGDVVNVTSAAADGGQVQYLIDTLGNCGGSGANAKALGGSAVGCPLCGEPINVGTGNLFEQVVDYHTAGLNQLGFTRYYNSMSA